MSNVSGQSPSHLSWWIPGLDVARTYTAGLFQGDFVAGLVLVAMLVPQGMAYAELAGLPPVTGLYATMIPLIAYAVFGPSRILILGPDSALAPVVAAAIIPIAGTNQSERMALAAVLAIMVGVLHIAGGIAGFGFITDLISRPVRLGYLAGIAVSVIASQLPRLLGFSVDANDLFGRLTGLGHEIGQFELTAAVFGLGTFAAILGLRRVQTRIPAALIAVVVALLASRWLDLDVETVGQLPEGLPSLVVPNPDAAEMGRLALSAVAIALIAFADTSVLSRSYASRAGKDVDQNRELRALGIANLANGLFQGFPVSSSSSRTPVAEAAGAKTQVTGLVSAVGLGCVLVFASGLFGDLPVAVLSAIVVAAVLGLIDVRGLMRLWQVHRPDFVLAVASFVGVAAFGVLWGVGIAIGLSILAFLWRSWHPYDAVLGRSPGVKGYHDITRYPDALQIPGLVLFRFDAPLFFANSGVFRSRLQAAVGQRDAQVFRVVVAAEPITDLDSTAADMLNELDKALEAEGIELAFAEMKDPVKDTLRRFGLVEKLGQARFFPTIGVAVRSFVEEFDVAWVDWEDEVEELSESGEFSGESPSHSI
ncbi:sulfate permease [soil metagenome]